VAIVVEDQILAPVITFTGASISRTLPTLPAVGEKVIVAVGWNESTGTALPAVSGWTKAAERNRTFAGTCFYWRDVTGAPDQAPAQTFTFPAVGPSVSIRDMWSISGAPVGAPQVTGGVNNAAAALTGSTGTTGVPADTGGLFLGIVYQSGSNGGEVDDATYPTGGFTRSLPDAGTTMRGTTVIKQNAPAAAQESTVKWLIGAATRTTVGAIIGFVPASPPAPPNVPPVANAGTDQTVTLGETVILSGSGTDSDGTIAVYEWTPPFGQTLTNSEIQTVTVGGSGLTSFTLTYSGQTTASLDDLATAAQVQTALENLSNIAVGDVAVVGDDGGPWTVTFRGALVNTNVAQLTSTPTGGTGTVTVATLRAGAATSATTITNPTWYTGGVAIGDYIFSLRVQDDDSAFSPADTVKITVEPVPVDPEVPPDPPDPPVAGDPILQWVQVKVTYTVPAAAVTKSVILHRSGGTGSATSGAEFPATFPFTLGSASASGDEAFVRHVFSGPGEVARFAVGGDLPNYTIERTADQGETSETVRNAVDVGTTDNELEILDGEAQPHTELGWRARASSFAEGVSRLSPWSEWMYLTPTPTLPGIKDPTNPATNIMLTVLDFGTEASSYLATDHQVFGVATPVRVGSGWTAQRGQLTVFVESKVARQALVDLLRSGAKLLLQRPSEDGTEEGEQWYIEVDGDVGTSRLTINHRPERTLSFGWREVRKP
jgi:hypothetical protein